MVQFKFVGVLTELCKLVMRPPNQLSAETNESRLFPTTLENEREIRPNLLMIILKLRKYTMILLLILFYYLISKSLSLIT